MTSAIHVFVIALLIIVMSAGEYAFAAEASYKAALDLPLNDTFRGQAGDNINDIYKVKTGSRSGIYTLKVSLLNGATIEAGNDSEKHMEIWLEDAKYKKVKSIKHKNTDSSVIKLYENQSNSLSYKLKPKSTYYVYMNNSAWVGEYRVKVSYQSFPAKGTIKKAIGGKKKITISYNKLKNASRYQVALKTKGGKWKVYSNKTALRRVFKKLKSGKKYSVKVRGQYRCNEKYFNGEWSSAKTVKVK